MNTNPQNMAFRIRSLDNQIKRLLERSAMENNEANLTGMQYAVLGYLGEQDKEDGVYQKDLEAEFNIRRSTASEMLITLEKRGYILRVNDIVDTRMKKIFMTPKAKEIGKIAKSNFELLQTRLTKGIPQDEIEQFFRTLEKISANAEE